MSVINTKPITLVYNGETFTTIIDISMSDNEIYQTLYDRVGNVVGASEIVLLEPQSRAIVAQLNYQHLRGDRPYIVEKSELRIQALGSQSQSAQVTAQHITQTLAYWNLQHYDQIFEGRWQLAPRQTDSKGHLPTAEDHERTLVMEPAEWSRAFSKQLLQYSECTKGRHAEAMEILNCEVEKRHARESDSVLQCTAADIKKAGKMKLRLVAEGAWKEVEEEDAATKTFGGGLSEALPRVEDDGDNESMSDNGTVAHAASFAIAVLGSRPQPSGAH